LQPIPEGTPPYSTFTASLPFILPVPKIPERLKAEEAERQRLAELERQRLELLGQFLAEERARLDVEL
jgi:hypothetical protein